ncbi:MAG: hypothetical protein IKT08_03455 [Bacteroidales bacterium]|nr:hypothetical protein [Bacteroidales bacterium]
MKGFYLYRKAWRYEGAPHDEPQLSKEEGRALLKKGGLLVRNTYDFDCNEETSFWYVIKDRFEGLDELKSNERNKIRRSLKALTFKKIGYELLEQDGWNVLKATYDDYTVTDRKMDSALFLNYLLECKDRGYEYWGIFHEKELIGFCTVWIWPPDCCEYGLIGILPEYKHNNTYPYYGLFHSLNEHYLGERKFRYVADGARTITEHSNIQNFLMENFNFRKAYCQLDITYKWWMKLAVDLLYPFRKFVNIPSVKAVLNMEAMRRAGSATGK